MTTAFARTSLRSALIGTLILLSVLAAALALGRTDGPPEVRPVAVVVGDDAGDGRATTTFDGPMVRQRAAIAIRPVDGADRRQIARQVRAAARAEKVGPLADATFAVFSEEMLTYLVPEMTFVLPEGKSVQDGERVMRDHRFPGVAFHLVQPVLVHDLTFAVIPAAGVSPGAVRAAQDREGILADSLNRYVTEVQPAGVTVRYFGALLSDAQILAVREAMGRAAQVPADRVAVAATTSGGGVDLSHGSPDLTGGRGSGHGH
ncbi:MAG TPA: hypothetical protein VF657_20810 [Actinoplanes sp.]